LKGCNGVLGAGLEDLAVWSHLKPFAVAVAVQQRTLQSFKTTFLSKYLDQNMHKNALFFRKIWKIAAALGAPPPDPPVVTPITCHSYFLEVV